MKIQKVLKNKKLMTKHGKTRQKKRKKYNSANIQ
jgi:hypothetical protein